MRPFSHDPKTIAAALDAAAIARGIVLAELHVRRPSLESHCLAVVEPEAKSLLSRHDGRALHFDTVSVHVLIVDSNGGSAGVEGVASG